MSSENIEGNEYWHDLDSLSKGNKVQKGGGII